MGCDIHLFTEKRVSGKWRSADKLTPDRYSKNKKELRLDYRDSLYHDRNYALFAILAGVRNGSGFAGVKTGEGFLPIADPRGLPSDTSKYVKSESDKWDCDGHSHSYLILAELLA